jgi:hypothetical protein
MRDLTWPKRTSKLKRRQEAKCAPYWFHTTRDLIPPGDLARMHAEIRDISDRILNVAIGALTQANQHAVYHDPGMDHWSQMSVLNAALAGELFLKAIIAKEHPLLIFRDLFQLDDPGNQDLKIEHVIEKGKTYNFEHLQNCYGYRPENVCRTLITLKKYGRQETLFNIFARLPRRLICVA